MLGTTAKFERNAEDSTDQLNYTRLSYQNIRMAKVGFKVSPTTPFKVFGPHKGGGDGGQTLGPLVMRSLEPATLTSPLS